MNKFQQQMMGDPVCGHCKYSLKGLTEAARCPECGRPIVETLVRTGMAGLNGVRYASRRTWRGIPLVCVASGPTAEQRYGHARGIIAVGDVATGVIAIGGFARGVIAIGGFSVGGFGLGGMSAGVLAVGGLAIGGVALGGIAAGLYGFGGTVFYLVQGIGGVRVRIPWFW